MTEDPTPHARIWLTTHTAGPWKTGHADDGENIWIGPSEFRRVAMCSRFHPPANVHLIAAAPDLLALAYQFRDDLRHPPTADSITRRLAAIDAAIAKATGKQEG